MRRNRAIATANGLRSTPWTAPKRTLRQLRRRHAGLSVLPGGEQSLERADQEVAATARGVDHLHGRQPVLGERGREGAIEDERLDEDRRLQQGEPLLGVLGEVLIQVAEESRVALWVGEVVDGSHIFGRVVERIPQPDQPASRIAGDRQPPQRVVCLVEQPRNSG